MSLHRRTEIRRKVAEILSTPVSVDGQQVWPTPAQDKVWPGRSAPVAAARLPVILAYDDSEDLQDPGADSPRRKMTLQIEARAQGADDPETDDAMDALALAVEWVMEQHPRLDGLAISALYTGMEKARDAEGDRRQGCIILNYQVEYVAPAYEPELEDFLLFHGEYTEHTGTVDEVELQPPAD